MLSEDNHDVLKKVLYIISFATFIALASLTASLPLNLPHNEQSQTVQYLLQNDYPTNQPYNNGDEAWMLIATIFGLFLAPALVYFYGALHDTDTSKLIKLVLLTASIITSLWIIFSFSLVYGEDAWGNQILGFPKTFYMFRDTGAQSAKDNFSPSITNSIFAIFELGFALVTPTIIAASVSDRINFNGFLLFIFIWHLVIYAPFAHIVWGYRGWFRKNEIRDFSGGIVVNQLAAMSALAIHLVLGKDKIVQTKPSSNPDKALQWAFPVWFLWFAFNAGKAHGANPVAAQSIVNTIAATTTAILTSYFYDLIHERATTSVSIANAVILGLVAITPASGYVAVGGAMCISIITVLLTRHIAEAHFKEGVEVNQPLSVITIHGLGGTIGFLSTAIFSYRFINPYGVNGLTYGRGIPLAEQISAVLAIWSAGFIAIYLVAFLSNLIVPLSEDGGYKAPATTETAAASNEKEVELTTTNNV